MIEYKQMDITSVVEGYVIHGVNCQKKMGSGVALAIKKKWPKVYTKFMKDPSVLGTVRRVYINDDLEVMNCYTQENCGKDGKKYASQRAIASCLRLVFATAVLWERPVYMPRIGGGLGGLSWELEVEPIVKTVHNNADGCFPGKLNVTICDFTS